MKVEMSLVQVVDPTVFIEDEHWKKNVSTDTARDGDMTRRCHWYISGSSQLLIILILRGCAN